MTQLTRVELGLVYAEGLFTDQEIRDLLAEMKESESLLLAE